MGVVLSAGAPMGERKNNLGTKGSATPPENHLRNHRVRFYVAFLIISLFGAVPCANAQQDPFDAVASDVAAAVAKASRKHNLVPKVLVADFSEAKGDPTALGPDLAQQFFLSLQAHARNFTLADRDKYLRDLVADKLTPESYQSPDNMKCYALELNAAFIVTGELEDSPDKVVVGIKVTRMDEHKVIFAAPVSLDFTPAMRQLLNQEPPVFASADSVPSSVHIHGSDRVPEAGKKGYSMPTCVYCPNATFTDEAVREKRQGTLVVSVWVGADGLAHEVSVLRGLACGFNKQAVDAVRRWKFRPATGPGGQPADVIASVEVSFRLY
jgi:TonB family protein